MLFVALYVAFVAGAVGTCLLGRAGIGGYRSLASYAGALRQNIAELQSLNGELAERLRLLRSDPATVKLLARQFGYVESGEQRVVLESYDPPPAAWRAGYVLQSPPSSTLARPPLETLYLIPLVALFVVLCVDTARRRDDG